MMKFGKFLFVDEGNSIFNLNHHDIRILLKSWNNLIVLENETSHRRIIELEESVDGHGVDFSVEDAYEITISLLEIILVVKNREGP